MKVLNLHGIYGKPNNTAYNELIKYFDNVYSPAIKYENLNPYTIIDRYKDDFDLIVGNSFGGFYACVLGTLTKARVITINPALPPYLYIDKITNGEYKFTNELKELFNTINFNKVYAILGNNDEVLNINITTKYVHNYDIINGGHRLNSEEFKKLFGGAVNESL